jgi:hypothetical protein
MFSKEGAAILGASIKEMPVLSRDTIMVTQ